MLNIEQSIVIDASPERVWQALTGEIASWWSAPYLRDSSRAKGLTMEPYVGGRLMEPWDEKGAGYLLGHIVEWLPPERLACTWMEKSWSGISTLVSFELTPSGKSTHLHLLHQGFERLTDGAMMREGIGQGWADLLQSCKTYIEQR